jgi:transcription antitermination factor NusG
MSELLWFIAYTLPRCEKKVAQYCRREGLTAVLPCCRTVHHYPGKTAVFQKPLFPGYVFLKIMQQQRAQTLRCPHLTDLLEVNDQGLFAREMETVLRAIGADLEIYLAPTTGEGKKTRVKSGPLAGIEGWVEPRHGADNLLITLNFTGQAAAVKLDPADLETVVAAGAPTLSG